jgi:thiol-disulfide isomerase/thioredoxin
MSDQSAAKPKGGILRWALWGAALFGVAAVLYIIVMASFKQPQETPSPAAVAGKGIDAKFVKPAEPTPAPDYVFYDETGAAKKISDFKGKVVLVNVWATWCGPCKIEMPTLAKLAGSYAGKPVEVVPISIDTADDSAKAKLFIAQNDPLKFYHDRQMKLPWTLKPAAMGMPTTIVYGRDGMERGRIAGEADWSAPDAKRLIDRVLAEG